MYDHITLYQVRKIRTVKEMIKKKKTFKKGYTIVKSCNLFKSIMVVCFLITEIAISECYD